MLIHPAQNRVSVAPGRFEPLALEILAATVPDHEVRILDLRLERNQRLEEELNTFEPDVLGVTANNTIYVNQIVGILGRSRKICAGIKQAVGGHHATMLPEDFYLPTVDAIFLGWAEKSFPAWIESVERDSDAREIPGITLLENGRPFSHRENLWDLQPGDIPHPDRALVARYNLHYRSDLRYRTCLVNTARGCHNRCSFCSVWKAANGKVLLRDAEDVYNEIASVPDHIPKIFFADDNTFIRPERAGRLCAMIRKAGIRKRYSAYCRSDTIIRYPEMMREWKEAGLDNLCVGFEGITDEVLAKLNKKTSVSRNEEAARILNELEIPFRPHFLIEPGFQKEDFKQILQYVRSKRLNSPIFPILTPLPGTDHYQEVKERICIGYEYFDSAHAVIPTKMSPRRFYLTWILLYQRSYPIAGNLAGFVRRTFGRITGNRDLVRQSYHLNLLHLVILKILSIILSVKLIRHYRWLAKSGAMAGQSAE